MIRTLAYPERHSTSDTPILGSSPRMTAVETNRQPITALQPSNPTSTFAGTSADNAL